jgi:hypothetical protein
MLARLPRPGPPLRLLGVGASGLEASTAAQAGLFDVTSAARDVGRVALDP